MISNKVSRTLFRSLLRWNRRPDVVASKFSIDTVGFGIDKILPKDYKVIGHEGVQAAIFHCFRNNPATDENMDLCFSVLKSLNELSLELKERLDFRVANMADERNSKATFKVGQIVRYKKLKYRGIVSGWIIDPETGTQKIEVVFDMMDVSENYDGRYRIDSDYIKSEHFTLIEDRFLTRVYNPLLHSYFQGYNESINRYIPKEELLFLYPRDFEAFNATRDESAESSASSLSENLKFSSDRVNDTVRNVGIKLESILKQYVSQAELDQMVDEMKDIELVKKDNLSSKSTNHLTVMRQVLDEVLTMIKMCRLNKTTATVDKTVEDGIRTIQFFESSSGDSSEIFGGDINDSEVRVKNNVMYQRLRRGGDFRLQQAKNLLHSASIHSNTRTSTMYDGLHLSMNRSYEALSSLTKLYNIIDQLLQLRFQNKGIAHFEGLRVVSDAAGKTALMEPEDPPMSKDENAVKSVHFLDTESGLPAAKFELGQVVRHKQFNYRGIISGYDQKPLIDVRKWDAVANTPLGAEQPFYKVIPDDRTPDSRNMFYAAQDNLELITDPDDMLISHKNIRHYFLGFDDATNKYIPKHKLSYCFPDAKQQATNSAKGFVMNSSEYTYDMIDKILIESYHALRESFSSARKDYVARSIASPTAASGSVSPLNSAKSDSTVLLVEDLLTHMRHASTRDSALTVEGVMWLVWMAHDDPDVNKAMRLGVSNAKRGLNDKAFDLYQLAQALDPNYSEAHNKLAALHHARGEDEECLKRAKFAVAQFPQHFGAFSGMGLALEKLGKFVN